MIGIQDILLKCITFLPFAVVLCHCAVFVTVYSYVSQFYISASSSSEFSPSILYSSSRSRQHHAHKSHQRVSRVKHKKNEILFSSHAFLLSILNSLSKQGRIYLHILTMNRRINFFAILTISSSRSLQSTKPNEKKMKITLSQKNGWIWGISTLTTNQTKPEI